MPYIHIKTNKTIDAHDTEMLKALCGNMIQHIPGKSETWLMVQIDDQQTMFFKGENVDCMKVDVQIYGETDQQSKKKFVEELITGISILTDIEKNNIYVTLQEYEHWGLLGSYM